MASKFIMLPVLAAILALTACGGGSPAASSTTSTAAAAPISPSATTPGATSAPVTSAASALAPDQVRAQAAAILQSTDDSLRADFEKGAGLTAGPQTDWWTGNGGDAYPVRVAKATTKAISDVNQLFTADNEPPSVTEWGSSIDLTGDVTAWYQSDHGQGQDPALKSKVEGDFSALDQLVASVRAGK